MKKRPSGFNIIELMVAIAISATMIATIVKSYASLYKLYAYNVKFLTVNHDMRLALQVMEDDINDAGVFGMYSLHNSSKDSFKTLNFSGGEQCSSPWCKLDPSTVGVKSFSNDAEGVVGGLSLANDSDIIKVQHGSDVNIAYV